MYYSLPILYACIWHTKAHKLWKMNNLKQQPMECLNDNHKPRDNKFGVTFCVKCGRLFTKPCGKDLKESDKLIIKLN